MLLAPLLLLTAFQQHDPPVLRCAFEDRSRMVLFNPTPGLWMAFNPTTCTLQKVWEGDVEWRGKVYDFSQDNSRAKGKTLYEAPNFLARLEDGKPGNWKLDKVTWNEGWNFADGGTIESPTFSTAGRTRLCVMFDETSRKGSVKAEIVGEDGKTQSWFDSTKHGHSDTDWQFNMKLLPNTVGSARLRITQPGDFGKKLRSIRVFADSFAPFYYDGETVTWKGYRYPNSSGGLTCLSEIERSDGKVMVEQELNANSTAWSVRYRVTGAGSGIAFMPGGMRLPDSVKVTGGRRNNAGLVFLLETNQWLTIEGKR
jgi:hypothetical protein